MQTLLPVLRAVRNEGAITLAAIATALNDRGSKLGNPTNIRQAGDMGCVTLAAAADEHAQGLLPVLRAVQNEGAITLAAIATALNGRKVRQLAVPGGTSQA